MKLGKKMFASIKELVAHVAPDVRQPKRPPVVLTPKQKARVTRSMNKLLRKPSAVKASHGESKTVGRDPM
jgi:hypothetical protein